MHSCASFPSRWAEEARRPLPVPFVLALGVARRRRASVRGAGAARRGVPKSEARSRSGRGESQRAVRESGKQDVAVRPRALPRRPLAKRTRRIFEHCGCAFESSQPTLLSPLVLRCCCPPLAPLLLPPLPTLDTPSFAHKPRRIGEDLLRYTFVFLSLANVVSSRHTPFVLQQEGTPTTKAPRRACALGRAQSLSTRASVQGRNL